MNPEKKELIATVDQKKDEIIDLLCALIQVDTTIPPGDTREAIRLIRSYLNQYNIDGRVYESDDQKHNFVVETGGDSGTSLCLNGHLDVVPADEEEWDFDPFLGAVKDGKVLGRGASDMKSGLVGLIFSFVQAHKYFQDDKLTLMAVTDEERGGMKGTHRVLHELDNHFDACLIAEPTRPDSISVGQKGAVWVKFTFQGVGGHGSLTPYKGQEVFDGVDELKKQLEGLRDYGTDMPGVPDDLIEHSKKLLRKLTGHRDAGNLLDHVSVNCGKINIGNAPNAVGSHATLWCDFRVPIGMKLDYLRNMVDDIVQDISEVVSYEVVKEKSANWSHPDSRLVQLLIENAREHYGTKPGAFLHQGSSDASYFRMRGIDTAQIGPGNIDTVHAANETVDIDDMLKAVKTYLGFLYDWQNQPA